MQLSTVIDVTVHFMSALIAAWLSTSTTILWSVMESSTQLPSTSTAKTSSTSTSTDIENVLEYEYRKKVRVRGTSTFTS